MELAISRFFSIRGEPPTGGSRLLHSEQSAEEIQDIFEKSAFFLFVATTRESWARHRDAAFSCRRQSCGLCLRCRVPRLRRLPEISPQRRIGQQEPLPLNGNLHARRETASFCVCGRMDPRHFEPPAANARATAMPGLARRQALATVAQDLARSIRPSNNFDADMAFGRKTILIADDQSVCRSIARNSGEARLSGAFKRRPIRRWPVHERIDLMLLDVPIWNAVQRQRVRQAKRLSARLIVATPLPTGNALDARRPRHDALVPSHISRWN